LFRNEKRRKGVGTEEDDSGSGRPREKKTGDLSLKNLVRGRGDRDNNPTQPKNGGKERKEGGPISDSGERKG